jgi:hypothetical protein
VSGPRLQRQSDVTTSGVDDALCQDGAELRHDVLVLVGDDLGVGLSEEADLGTGLFSLLDQDHGGGDQSPLTDEIDGIEHHHRLQKGDGLAESGPGTRYAQSHGGSVAHVGVVALGQEGHHAGTLLRGPAKEKKIKPISETHSGGLIEYEKGIAL